MSAANSLPLLAIGQQSVSIAYEKRLPNLVGFSVNKAKQGLLSDALVD